AERRARPRRRVRLWRPRRRRVRLQQTAPDNLWTSVKVGLFDFADEHSAWTSGIKVGPKAPLARGNQGPGLEGLLLLGWRNPQVQLVFNLGGLIDPAAEAHTPRPTAVEGGASNSTTPSTRPHAGRSRAS